LKSDSDREAIETVTNKAFRSDKSQAKGTTRQYEARIREINTRFNRELLRRRQLEKSLKELQKRYHRLVIGIPCVIIGLNRQGRITFFNHFAEESFGYQASEIVGQSIFGTIVPLEEPSFHRVLRGKKWKSHTTSPNAYDSWEGKSLHANGQSKWFEWVTYELAPEAGIKREIICVGIDRTARKSMEEQVVRQAAEKAVTGERDRLARELHDAVSQTLFSVNLIAEVMPILWERDQEEGRRRLNEIQWLTKSALFEMRTLLLELRPSALIDTPLKELLSQLAEAVRSRMVIPVVLSVTECQLLVETKMAFYRIAQEALNNIVKHSQASQVKISLSCLSGQLELRIMDNGIGFDATSIPGKSLGVKIMQERAEAIGAVLEIKSQAGIGTEVTVRLKDVQEKGGTHDTA
jgi:PAS domain S-box-containing protein